ncbi:MAG: adenylate/guanylate cyclase domain-containing protein [Chthonomonadaceae bacterium]|nr:adenylate/guanylate cyclase domain-containing protein [Chthonomonadaceae bacterium]
MTTLIPLHTAVMVITLCGAFVLFLIDLWLRKRGASDSSLMWLYLSVLSWAASAAVSLLPLSWVNNHPDLHVEPMRHLLSPVSSLLFVVAAFRLTRVREVFRRESLRCWPPLLFGLVAVLSLIALIIGDRKLVGNVFDATASSVALVTIGAGLIYSFYRYANPLLMGLTGITIAFSMVRQFVEAFQGPLQGNMAIFGLASTTTLTLLLIALAVAWGLSDTSRVRIIGVPCRVNVIALFFDLRGSSRWTVEVLHGDYEYVGTFMDELRGWAWRKVKETSLGRPNLIKFLGDGFLMVWELPQESESRRERMAEAVLLGCSLVKDYPLWTKQNRLLWKEVPLSLGVGIDVGAALRLTFENGSEDYLGEPVNLAAKLQDRARPSGGVVIREELWRRLESEPLQKTFSQAGSVSFGEGEPLLLRATKEVKFAKRLEIISR